MAQKKRLNKKNTKESVKSISEKPLKISRFVEVAKKKEIQIDMYEVQLGASLLLQFKDKKDCNIKVLADAGISKIKGYTQGHVHTKLLHTLGDSNGAKRLDLIIGTHYDEDHLNGLIPIIEDQTIEIGEVWLPPVANDTEPRPAGLRVVDNHLLPYQFADENGQSNLKQYLKVKQTICEELKKMEQLADKHRGESFTRQNFNNDVNQENFRQDGKPDDNDIAYFKSHLRDADATLGALAADADLHDFAFPASGTNEDSSSQSWRYFDGPWRYRHQYFQEVWQEGFRNVAYDAVRFAGLRKSSAKDAITAIYLSKVVAALKVRNIPIACHIIEDGMPLRFVWDNSRQRFMPGANLVSDGPTVTLLGPSQGLVTKLRDKIPLGSYQAFTLMQFVDKKSISPSNQLSYVLRFEAENQGILICGDAGCVDFKPKSGLFYPAILNQLLPLHVIQVAHHAGCNADFYNVLLAAGYPAQTDKSLLLLSHSTDDTTRPSKEFGVFIAQARQPGDDMKLLFTSRPTFDKVRDYLEIIHRSVGGAADVGDVRLVYNGTEWIVQKHAVEVPADIK